MVRRFHGLRHQQHLLRQLAWLHIDTKKLAFAIMVTALALSGGTTLLTGPMSEPAKPKPQTAPTTISTTSSHPLLGLEDTYSPLPGLDEASDTQQPPSSPSLTEAPGNGTTNKLMHQTTVTINGESIEIPPAGTSHQTIKNQDGSQTEVDIQHDQTQVDGTPRSNIIIDSQSVSSNPSTSLNSRITITH